MGMVNGFISSLNATARFQDEGIKDCRIEHRVPTIVEIDDCIDNHIYHKDVILEVLRDKLALEVQKVSNSFVSSDLSEQTYEEIMNKGYEKCLADIKEKESNNKMGSG